MPPRTRLSAGIRMFAPFFLLLFSCVVVWKSRKIGIYSTLGPGPGFFPFFIGSGLLVLSCLYAWMMLKESAAPVELQRPVLWRSAAIVVLLVGAGCGIMRMGFIPTIAAVVIGALLISGERRIWVLLIAAAIGSVGTYVLFQSILDVPLPSSRLGLVPSLGL